MKAFALYCGNTEPSIDELLGDPIMHVLMKRDGVPPRDVRALIATARRRQRRSAAVQMRLAAAGSQIGKALRKQITVTVWSQEIEPLAGLATADNLVITETAGIV